MVKEHEQAEEPELKPSFIRRMKKIQKEKGLRFKNFEELRRFIENR